MADGIAGLLTSGIQANAQQKLGEYQKQQFDLNAKLDAFNADDAINRGNVAVTNQQTVNDKAVGSARAALGASGVSVNSGSAAAVQSDTRAAGALDILTIKNNAWREAWGYKVQGINDTLSGNLAEAGAQTQAGQTLLTGGISAAAAGAKVGLSMAGVK